MFTREQIDLIERFIRAIIADETHNCCSNALRVIEIKEEILEIEPIEPDPRDQSFIRRD